MAKKAKASKAKSMKKLEAIVADMTDEEAAEVAIRMRAKLKRIKAGKE